METIQQMSTEHKTVAGGKDIRMACTTCTFLNAPDVTACTMCGAEMKPPTHDVQGDGSWKCGGCATLNGRAVKDCTQCHLPFYSLVTTAAPAQIFCSRCGFLNDGGNLTCVQCNYTIRSTLDKISTDLRDSTNFLARDMGVNIHVKCPGCLVVCFVPPATACLRCGACHTYFASPSVGEVTNFHMTRLASSISSSFMGFFGGGKQPSEAEQRAQEARDAPVGRLIAAGRGVVQSPRQDASCALSESSESREQSSSFRLDQEVDVSGDEAEEKSDATQLLDSQKQNETMQEAAQRREKPRGSPLVESQSGPMTVEVSTHSASKETSADNMADTAKDTPLSARPMPVRSALPPPPQDLYKVEGDIVEL